MKNKKQLIGTYQTQHEVEDAIKLLKKNNYDITKLSIHGVDCYTEQNVVGYHALYDKIEKWGELGLFTISLYGILFCFFFFFNLAMSIPFFKNSIIYTYMAILIASAVPLIILAISKNTGIKYKIEIRAEKYMLYTQENSTEMDKIRTLLKIHLPKENTIAEKENQQISKKENMELY